MLIRTVRPLPLLAIAATIANSQPAPMRGVVEALRLGGENAAEPFAFPVPPRLVVDSTGTMYVRVAPDGAVLVLQRDGRLVRTIGRKGAGPGEFEVALRHGLVGDTLWILNAPTPRISLFTSAGRHVSTNNVALDLGRRFASPTGISGLLADGHAYVEPSGTLVGAAQRVMMPVLVGRRSMTDVDTITMVPVPRGMAIAGVGTIAFDPMPVPPLIAASAMGLGIAVATWTSSQPSVVDLRVVSPTGVERFRRRVSLDAEPVTNIVRDSLIAIGVGKAKGPIDAARRRRSSQSSSSNAAGSGGRAGAAPQASLAQSYEQLVKDALNLPERHPPVRQVVFGADGTIWLDRSGRGEVGRWLALSDRGEMLFEVRLPRRFQLQQATMSSIWGIETDSLGVAYIVRFDVAGSAR